MTFSFVVPSSASSSSVLSRTAQRGLNAAKIASALALLAAALPACAGGDPVSADDLVLQPTEGQALSHRPTARHSTSSGSAAPSAQSEAAAQVVTSDGFQPNGDGNLPTTLADAPCAPGDDSAPAANENSNAQESQATPVAEPPAEDTAAADETVPAPAAAPSDTMRTSGRRLLDACGNVFVTRGVEQIFGNQLPEGNDWLGLLNQIAASGVNAVRILVGSDTLRTSDVDALLNAVAAHHMVAYVGPYGSEGQGWLGHADVKAMLDKHKAYILIDAFGEPTFDDRDRFVSEASASLKRIRDMGYTVPLTVTANQFGRDLPSIFELGPQILAADPLHNTVFGWQAYWSTNGYYQNTYGYSLEEGVAAAAAAPFPVQLGLDRVTDFPSDVTADFGTLMNATEANGIGWLWWDWYNPYGNENSLTNDGSASNLTPTGRTVINTHAASVKNTAHFACQPR
jgi:hypothetical protein